MPRPFRQPRPNFFLMWVLGFVSRWCFLRGYFRIRSIDLPRADRERLATAVNRDTAAFIGPNHPEFGFDWIMDKEISTRVAPRMASWASHEIIETSPGFWTANNLIGHNGGEAATAYSVSWALRGEGVLLHPEGSVHWTGDRVHSLFHGIAEMACGAARRAGDRPVFIVPVVWKLCYARDVSSGIHRDMAIIERHLGLADGPPSTGERFRALQEGILERQMVAHGFNPTSVADLDFFARQDAFRDWLIEALEMRYAVEPSDSIERTITRFKRAIAAAVHDLHNSTGTDAAEKRILVKRDRARADEASRLLGFSRDVYAGPRLTQEQIAESLKRHRATLVKGGLWNTMQNFLPKPFGPRVAHVRVPAPIRVDPARCSGDVESRTAYAASLIDLARRRMQESLDAISRETHAKVDPYCIPNPFVRESWPDSTARRHPIAANRHGARIASRLSRIQGDAVPSPQ